MINKELGICLIKTVTICIGALLFSSCSIIALKKELKQIEQTTLLEGEIINTSPHGKPVVVLIYELKSAEKKLVAYSIHHKLGTFRFIRPPGRYMIVAFEDTNEDLVYQSNEYAGYYGAPTIIDVEQGKVLAPLNVTSQQPGKITLSVSPDLSSPASRGNLDLAKTRAGEVVSLDDARFTHDNGKLGLWEPTRFLKEVGEGVYFLEPYNERKTPVLFIHGTGGCPQEWSYIIEHLDRKRFQPWVCFYPSGLRLKTAVELIRYSLSEILIHNKPENIVIIAHSTGGLVSRGLINLTIGKMEEEEKYFRGLFITIATPWRGHRGACVGVKHSPVVIPSWIDMVPGSPYQEALFERSLPEYINYYLLFGFKGSLDPFIKGNNDGTVSLASALYFKAQKEAVKVYGFNKDDVSILRDKTVSDTINQILKE